MQTIYKYDLQPMDNVEIVMPAGAKILCVQMQGESPRVWALVDLGRESVKRIFHVVGTGHKHASIRGDYVGTFQMYDGELVFHVFCEKE